MDVILEWEETSFTKEYADFKFGRKETIFYTKCAAQYSKMSQYSTMQYITEYSRVHHTKELKI